MKTITKIKLSAWTIPMIALFASTFLLSLTYFGGGKDWVVPDSAKKMKNPVPTTADNLKTGKALFSKSCKSCHGATGKGDGTKAKGLDTPCPDFTDKKFQSQTDGAIFYKSKEGRDDMPSFKKDMTDEEIWTLVNYIRTFGGGTKPPVDDKTKPPVDDKTKPDGTDPKKPPVDKPIIDKKDSSKVIVDTVSAPERKQIELVLQQYEKALNGSDTTAITALFTSDAIFMPLNGASAIGTSQIKASYKQMFTNSQLNLKFSAEEIKQYGDIAFIRANSKGEHTFLGFNQKVTEENRAFIFLKKENGIWKIYRFMVN